MKSPAPDWMKDVLADALGRRYRAVAATTPITQVKLEAALPFKLAGCAACGETRLPTLDFHHRDPAQKKFNIALGYRSDVGYNEFVDELEKCVVLCANCHRCYHAGLDIGIELGRPSSIRTLPK